MKLISVHLLVGTFLVALIGCGSREEKVVAKVGKKKITVREYEETIPKIPSTYLSTKKGIEGVKDNLRILLDRELVILEAQKRGIDKEKGFISAWEQMKQEILYHELLKREIKDKADITGEEKRFEERLMKLFDVTFDQETIAHLVERGKTAIERIPNIPIEEEGKPIATFKGGKFTIGDYVSLLEDLKPNARPVADDSTRVVDFIRSVLHRVQLSNLAIQHFKIENDQKIASRLREKRLEMMVDELTRREVGQKIEVSQEEVDTYYQAHKERYLTLLPAQARVRAVALKTEKDARKLLRTIKGSGELSALVERYKDQKRVVDRPSGSMERVMDRVSGVEISVGDFHLHPFETKSYGDLATQAFQVPIGRISGPIHVPPHGYAIFEVVEREDPGSPQSNHFIKARHLARTELRAEKAGRLYDQFLLSLRKKYAGETFIFDDRLRFVKSPADTIRTGVIDTTRKG
ncbi:MAG: peptidyl-prolyl cis-trans isomerase [Candidatus Latescibacteria bacterium]|nr:peptidyl-prolyl cis-trans isomerase [Candidatus Latescibacterota bacterium]